MEEETRTQKSFYILIAIFLYGFIKNTYVMFADGANTKNVWFR